MSTDFLSELGDTVQQTCKLLEAPEHRNDVAQVARCLEGVIDYLERKPTEPKSDDDEGLGFARWLIVPEPINESSFVSPFIRPFPYW